MRIFSSLFSRPHLAETDSAQGKKHQAHSFQVTFRKEYSRPHSCQTHPNQSYAANDERRLDDVLDQP
jgi:hypothetical protein